MNPNPRQTTLLSSIKNVAITQSIAVVFFVVMPILITLVAPLSRIEFRKSDTGTTVTVDRFVLIFVLWRTERITNATRIRADIIAASNHGGTQEERRQGKHVYRAATGQVAILGDGPEVIVQAAPELAHALSKEFDDFQANEGIGPKSFAVYASWPLSYVLGGVVTSLCAFYVVCVALAVLIFPFKLIRSTSKTTTPEISRRNQHTL